MGERANIEGRQREREGRDGGQKENTERECREEKAEMVHREDGQEGKAERVGRDKTKRRQREGRVGKQSMKGERMGRKGIASLCLHCSCLLYLMKQHEKICCIGLAIQNPAPFDSLMPPQQ